MVRITVNVYANLREYTGGAASVDVDIEPGRSIGDVLDQIGIPREKTRVIFVNNRAARLDDPLSGQEQLDVFSAVGGG